MNNQQDHSTGSLQEVKDSVQITGQKDTSVFLTEEPGSPFDYKPPEDINRDLTPDWILYFSVASLILLAWLRIIYSKFIVELFKSAFNYQLSLKIYEDPGLIQKRIFIFLNLFYFLTTGIFLYLVLDYFGFSPFDFKGLKFMGVIIAALGAYSLFRYISMKLTGYLFSQQDLFSRAAFHNFLYNKIGGIVIIPFILLVAYTRDIVQDISVYAGLGALTALILMRIIRLFTFIIRRFVLIFYFILYLCTLEILPLLVIVKLILSLS